MAKIQSIGNWRVRRSHASMPGSRGIWAIALVGCALLGGCGIFVRGIPLPTVPGPESPEIARTTRLCLSERRDDGRLLLRRLSDGKCTELDTGSGRVVDLAGPDRQGRIAYQLERHRSDHLWVVDAESQSRRQPFPPRPEEPMFTIEVLELSPVGGRLAFRRTRVSQQDPSARIADLAVLDLATGAIEAVWSGAIYDMAWFPDGNRLAFVESAAPAETIRVLDLRTRTLTLTSEPVARLNGVWVGPGGTHVYGTAAGRLGRINVATGERETWALSGLVCPIAFSEDGKVVGIAWPTEGSKQEYRHSPIYGPTPKFAIKLFDLASGASCTVAPPTGRYDVLSGGEIGE